MNTQPYRYELCPRGATSGQTTGTYAVCWVENPDNLPDDPPFTHIGSFTMYGPEQIQTLTCTMGRPCDIVVPGRLVRESAAMVIRGDTEAACRSKIYHTEFVDFGDGFGNPIASLLHE